MSRLYFKFSFRRKQSSRYLIMNKKELKDSKKQKAHDFNKSKAEPESCRAPLSTTRLFFLLN